MGSLVEVTHEGAVFGQKPLPQGIDALGGVVAGWAPLMQVPPLHAEHAKLAGTQ